VNDTRRPDVDRRVEVFDRHGVEFLLVGGVRRFDSKGRRWLRRGWNSTPSEPTRQLPSTEAVRNG